MEFDLSVHVCTYSLQLYGLYMYLLTLILQDKGVSEDLESVKESWKSTPNDDQGT